MSKSGDRPGALAAGEEAVALYRALARENPQAFTAGLARSLGGYGQALLNGGSAAEARTAMDAFLEGAQVVKPFMGATPEAFSGLFERLIDDFVSAAHAAGAEAAEISGAIEGLGVRPGGEETELA